MNLFNVTSFLGSFILGIAFATTTPAAETQPPLPPTLQERAVAIAIEYKISTTTFSNLIYEESKWDEEITASPQGDRGLLQINRKWHSEVSDECAYDADCAMRWAAEYISKNGWDEWTPCNCYSYAQVITKKKFPLAQFIVPNGPPAVGSVAIMNFDGVIHYEVITGFDETGFFYKGSNRQPCVVKAGHEDFNDARLVGFWTP